MFGYGSRVLLVVVLLMFSVAVSAQNTPSESLLVGSVGLLGEDGSVFYSVLLGSRFEDDLSDVTITSSLPEGATFVEAFWTPEAAAFVGEDAGIVTWALPELPAGSIMGPFTYRVTFDEDEAAIPANAAATATWSEGEVSAQLSERELTAYEDTGSLTVDAAGTDGLVQVENTGVYLLVPQGAFDQSVTLTFERQLIDEQADLPPVPEGENIWWCTLFTVSVAPTGVEASQPIYFLFPTRRTLTPGMEVIGFTQPPEGAWETWEGTGAARVSPNGNHIITSLTLSALTPGSNFSAGLPVITRAAAIKPAFSSPTSGPSWVDPDPDPWIDPDFDP